MNIRAFIPGLIILLIGAFFLLRNFGVIDIRWDLVWRLWPLLLIIAGLSLLITNRRSFWIGVGLLIILVFAVLWIGTQNNWQFLKDIGQPQEERKTTLTQTYTATSARTKFILDAGAGTYSIGGVTDELITVDSSSTQGEFTLNRTEENGITTLKLEQKSNIQSWSFGTIKNTATVRLNENPLWEILLKTGAAELNADLSAYKVDKLDIDAGAASVEVKLGDKQTELKGTISTGASSLVVRVPKSVGCEIKAETGLSNKDFDGFVKDGNTYHTEDFDDSMRKIYLTIKSGVSNLRVERY